MDNSCHYIGGEGRISFEPTVAGTSTQDIGKGWKSETYSGEMGTMLFQRSDVRDATIWYKKYFIQQPMPLVCTYDAARITLRFSLQHSFHHHSAALGERLLHDGSFNLLYEPFVRHELLLAPGEYTILEIILQPALLRQLQWNFPILKSFCQRVDRKEAAVLTFDNQQTSREMNHVIGDLLHNPWSANAQPLYRATKVMELLILVMERVTDLSTRNRKVYVKEDIEKIYAAKDELLKDLEKPQSLEAISRKVGMNLPKLRAAFFEFYGMSMLDCRLSARMTAAKYLLEDTDDSLESVAYATGYANAQHFSKAFKKYVKSTPAQWRKERRTATSPVTKF